MSIVPLYYAHIKRLWVLISNPMKHLLSACLLFCLINANAKNYYFSSNGSNANNGLSPLTPWQTLTKLNSFFSNLQPGDSVLFRKGETFIGHFAASVNGSSGHPIYIGTYGTGSAPIFQYDIAANLSKTIPQRAIVYAAAGISYITIDGIKFTDTTKTTSNIHTSTTANVGYAIDFDGSGSTGCNGNTLSNLDISLVGIAIELKGNNNTVTNCKISDLGGVVNQSGNSGNYGANGIVLAGSNNTITRNTFSGCWRTDLFFTYDGGAIELFNGISGKTNNNLITYNTSLNCNGFMESGGSISTDSCAYNTFAYNLIINSAGRIITIHNGGDGFSNKAYQFKFYNNDIVETVRQYDDKNELFASSASTTSNLIELKNNIFWITTSINIAKSNFFNGSQLTHTNNLYHLNGGSLNFTAGGSETVLSNSTNIFTSATGDPTTWNYIPLGSSPAINYGTPLGYTVDFNNVSIIGNPDAGIMEEVTSKISPSVSISSPVANAIFDAPASITITATATDADGSITKVDFYNGNIFLGSDTTSPYSFTWNNVAAGNYSLIAKATDNDSLIGASAAILVSVSVPTVAPTISIATPTRDTSYTALATIRINAQANSANGTIKKVEFLSGGKHLYTTYEAPYTCLWSNVKEGNYKITAKATDNNGLTTTSDSVLILVVANKAPVVNITGPDNTNFDAPATITIDATATDDDGFIVRVDFYNGDTLLGSDYTSPYSFTLNNIAAGKYSFIAKATDNSGLSTTSSSIAVVVSAPNAAPTVNITSPLCNAVYDSGQSITLEAEAYDIDGIITKVDFYNGDIFLGSTNTSPYSFTWKNVTPGSYALKAKTYDNKGAAAVSATISVSVLSPVTFAFTSFDGITIPKGNQLAWSTTNYKNTSYFKVLRGQRRMSLKQIGMVNYVNSDSSVLSYTFIDSVPYLATNYYRIVEVDNSGKIVASSIIALSKTTTTTMAKSSLSGFNISTSVAEVQQKMMPSNSESIKIKLGPNPTSNILSVLINGIEQNKSVKISVLSTNGTLFKTINSNTSNFAINLDVSFLVAGTYLIQAITEGKIVYKQFVKQ